METKEFDALIKSKFEENDFEYNRDNWDRMLWKLEDNSRNNKGKAFWLTIAVGMAASLTLLAAVRLFNPSPVNHQAQTAAKTSATPAPAGKTGKAAPAPQLATVTTPRKPSHIRAHIDKPVTAAVEVPEAISFVPQTNEHPATEQETAEKPVIDLAGATEAAQVKKTRQAFDQPFYEPQLINTRKINFSFGGGYNYGSQGSGYLVSASASKKLGGKFYLEGDLALVNNSATNTSKTNTATAGMQSETNRTPGTNNNNGGFTGSGDHPIVPAGDAGVGEMPYSEPVISTNSLSLFYVQLTPVLGYNVHKKLRVGMGADFQRLLRDDIKVQDAAGNIYNVPGLDLGVVGKAEIAVSNRIRTSISYREGVSNAIGRDKMYLDRDYLQIQLKYTINQ